MTFEYYAGPQKSPEWFQLRQGKVTASRLEDWLSVSKAKGKEGKPLQKRLDYEKELMFERTFNTSFEHFVSSAMQDGVDFEDFARKQYEQIKDVKVEECGAWYNDLFCASPDGMVGEDGLVEVKVVRDNSFTDILDNGVPEKWWKQCQGQLWASGKKWCDFVAINLNTKKLKVIRVLPDKEFQDWLELSVPEPLTVEPFSNEGVYDFVSEAPAIETNKFNIGF